MNRIFVYRRRSTGTGFYVSLDEDIARIKYVPNYEEYLNLVSGPVDFDDWSRVSDSDRAMLLNREYYVELPPELFHVLTSPEYLDAHTCFSDRLTIPALVAAGIHLRRPPVKGSNTKHKIGVPKNKLP